MAIGDRVAIYQSLTSGSTYTLRPPAGSCYMIESIETSGPIEFYLRPTNVVNGSGSSFRVHYTEGRASLNNIYIPVDYDCYFIAKNVEAGSFSVGMSFVEIPGPIFYYAEAIPVGAPSSGSSIFLLNTGEEGIIKTLAHNGGAGVFQLHGLTSYEFSDRSAGMSQESIYPSLNIAIDDTRGVQATNYHTSAPMTIIVLGIQTK